MSFVKQSNANAAATIISRLQKRNMEGYFCETSEEAVKKALSLMPEGSVISWGGSMSISECGLMDAIRDFNYILVDKKTKEGPLIDCSEIKQEIVDYANSLVQI